MYLPPPPLTVGFSTTISTSGAWTRTPGATKSNVGLRTPLRTSHYINPGGETNVVEWMCHFKLERNAALKIGVGIGVLLHVAHQI